MRHLFHAVFLFFLSLSVLTAQNQAPVISNLTASTEWIDNMLILTLQYDVFDAENEDLNISMQISDDAGKTYAVSNFLLPTGSIGYPVSPGTNHFIATDITALAAMPVTYTVRLVADDLHDPDLQAIVDEVDSTRMRNRLEFVQGIRHRVTGATHLNEVRDSIRGHFSALGLPVQDHSFQYGGATGFNIVGTSAGVSAGAEVVIVDAHYDTVTNSPGADDNGSGTIGMMEVAQVLSRYPMNKTLRFIGFDMEEDGVKGSTAYIQNGIAPGEEIAGVFNFEMIGYYTEQPNSQELPAGFDLLFPDATAEIAANSYRGDFLTNVGNANSAELAAMFDTAAQQYVPGLKVITLVVPGTGQIAPDLLRSDHAPFWLTGRKALMLVDGADFRNDCYHKPQDTLGKLNFTFMSNIAKATAAAAAKLAGIIHGDWATTDFSFLVSTQQPGEYRCAVRYEEGRIAISAPECPVKEAWLDLFDAKGALLMSHPLELTAPAQFVNTPPLQAGMYFARLRWQGGASTQKMIVAH
ncbi:MAG: M28 family peptidase [Lewinellaceae bacterium]|nr:M28 family peptidase [Lewinellaceae bacterium]